MQQTAVAATSQRDESLDTIKALATICVVLVHAANLYGYSGSESYLVNHVYGFLGKFAALGVPLFFVVSGYLASMQYKPGRVWYKANLKKKAKALVVPFLSWSMFYFVLDRVMFGHATRSALLDLFGVPFGEPPIYNPLWFIRDLYLLTILLPGLKKLASFCVPTLIGCASLWFLLGPSEFYEFRSCLWYVIGILIQTHSARVERIFSAMSNHLATAVLGGTLWVLATLWPVFWLQQAVIAAGVLLVWVFFRSLTGRENRPLAWLRRWIFPASFVIFVMHGKILSVMQILYTKILGSGVAVLLAGYFILPAVVIVVCVVANALLRKTPVYSFLTGSRG